MRLNKIISESTKTDFFDMYVLKAYPYGDDPEVRSLLEDRVDRILPILIRQAHNYAVGNYIELTYEEDLDTMVQNMKQFWPIDIYDAEGEARLDISKFFYRMVDAIGASLDKKFNIIDEFLGAVHNGGNIADHFPKHLHWMKDALYLRALADFNTLRKYASDSVKELTGTAIYGISGRPVSDDDKMELLYGKIQRANETGRAPSIFRYDPPKWQKSFNKIEKYLYFNWNLPQDFMKLVIQRNIRKLITKISDIEDIHNSTSGSERAQLLAKYLYENSFINKKEFESIMYFIYNPKERHNWSI